MVFVALYLVCLVGLLWALWAVMARFDRRRRLAQGRADLPLTSGSGAVGIPVTLALDARDVPQAVQTALHRVGARDITVVDDRTMVGWLPMTWRSFGHQVGIAAAPGPGATTLLCCSRPRLSVTLNDRGASRRNAEALADELGRFAARP